MARKEKNRARDRKYHYTYLIRDLKNKKVYYGVHSTDYDPYSLEDYHSSSKHLKLIIKEEGFDNFTKEVRRFFNSRVEADKWESKLLNRIGAKDHQEFYNKSNGDCNFVASGYVTVQVKGSDEFIRVPVDDPYIGELYNYTASGRKMPEDEKNNLSRMYKGKRSGKDNPVHRIVDKDAWRIKLSKASEGRELSEDLKEGLRRPEHWGHLLNHRASEEAQKAMEFRRSINNNKHQGFWLYKGEVFLYPTELPVSTKNKAVTYIEKGHPVINLLQAGGIQTPSIKIAAKQLNCHTNTIRNRINSPLDIWKDYFWFEDSEVVKMKEEAITQFKCRIEDDFTEEIEKNRTYQKPLSLGISDEDFTKGCMETGNFLKGTTFKKLYIKDPQGCYSRYETYCPLCSNDKYAKLGVCSGIFEGGRTSLLSGSPACRCGDSKIFDIKIFIHEVEQLCQKEGLQYKGLIGELMGAKETKIEYVCRKDNTITTNSLGRFLSGTRCKCCIQENRELDIPKIDLTEEFAFRKELYKEKYNHD